MQDKFSLRDAIHAVNGTSEGSHQIEFNLAAMGYSPPMHLIIGLQSALEPINRSVTIDGLGVVDVRRGPFAVLEEGPPKFRIFEVNSGVSVTITDLGIFGGDVTGDGGGILNNGSLTLDGCKVSGHNADGDGGGIKSNGALILDGTTVSGSSAGDNGGGIAYTSNSNFSITGSLVFENSATGNGGGIYVLGDNSPGGSITGTHIYDNTSTEGSGGGMYVNYVSLIMSGGSISGNNALEDGGGLYSGTHAILQLSQVAFNGNWTDANGGAIAIAPSVLQQTDISNCTFLLNECTDLQNGKGGAIYISSEGGKLVLTACTFDRNKAAKGGGLYTDNPTEIYGGLFVENTATVAGGGMYGGNADALLRGDEFEIGVIFNNNEAPANMGDGIAWLQNGAGTIDYVIGGNDDIDFI